MYGERPAGTDDYRRDVIRVIVNESSEMMSTYVKPGGALIDIENATEADVVKAYRKWAPPLKQFDLPQVFPGQKGRYRRKVIIWLREEEERIRLVAPGEPANWRKRRSRIKNRALVDLRSSTSEFERKEIQEFLDSSFAETDNNWYEDDHNLNRLSRFYSHQKSAEKKYLRSKGQTPHATT